MRLGAGDVAAAARSPRSIPLPATASFGQLGLPGSIAWLRGVWPGLPIAIHLVLSASAALACGSGMEAPRRDRPEVMVARAKISAVTCTPSACLRRGR